MNYLFVTLDAAGNVHPELALARRLVGRGHRVRFLAGQAQRRLVEAAGCSFAPWSTAPDFDSADPEANPVKDWAEDPATAFQQLCDHFWFGPAAAVARDVLAELEREAADVVVVDYFVMGALAAAERAAVPAVVLWHTIFGEYPIWNLGLDTFNAARSTLGLAPLADVFEQYRVARRVLVLTSRFFDMALTTDEPKLPDNVVHVGPQLVAMPGPHRAQTGQERPLVLVSLSSSYQGQERILRTIVDALGTLPVRGLVTTGRAVQVEGPVPDNVSARAWVDHAKVLPEASLVVTHGGMGTVMAAMAHGVPMVCVPLGRDQHGNAERVQSLGCGLVVDASTSVGDLAAAVEQALADGQLARRAAHCAAEMRRDIERDAAVGEIEAVASGEPRSSPAD